MSEQATNLDERAYPSRPYLGVSAVIRTADKLLLVERGKPPNLGIWSLPGGVVETGESLKLAIRREIREETGLDFEPERLAEMVEVIRHDDVGKVVRHFVIAVFYASLTQEDELRAGDDAASALWVPLADLKAYPMTDGTLDVITKVLGGKSLDHSQR